MKRVAIALLIAPLWTPVLVAIYAAFFWSPPGFMGDIDPGSWIGTAAFAGALFGYVAVLVIGLPAYKMLQRRNYRSIFAYLASWFTLAVVGWLVVFIAGFARNGLVFSFSYLADTIIHRPSVPLSFGVVWALVGATFWAIVRPDRELLSDENPR